MTRLAPGEDVVAMFGAWDAAGQVPASAILTKYIGTNWGSDPHAGHQIVAVSPGHPWKPGDTPTEDELESYRTVADVQVKNGGNYYVMAPKEK